MIRHYLGDGCEDHAVGDFDDVGSASPPTADVPTCGSQFVLSSDDLFPTFRECGEPAGHRGPHYGGNCSWTAVDHSGVAGEPEATTKKASQIAVATSPTPTHVDTVSGPGAADLAGGVVVSAEAVTVAMSAANSCACASGMVGLCCIRTAVAAAAPLIVEHYLRTRIRDQEVVSTPEEVWDRVREMARSAALRTVAVDGLRAAADSPDINSCMGVCAEVLHERADELERGTDHG